MTKGEHRGRYIKEWRQVGEEHGVREGGSVGGRDLRKREGGREIRAGQAGKQQGRKGGRT